MCGTESEEEVSVALFIAFMAQQITILVLLAVIRHKEKR